MTDSIVTIDFNNKKMQLRRTLAIIEQLSEGKYLTLKSGHRIGMGEDLSIGFVIKNLTTGEETISLSDLGIHELNELLEKNGVGFPVPNVKNYRTTILPLNSDV